jgi:hypothetical protein
VDWSRDVRFSKSSTMETDRALAGIGSPAQAGSTHIQHISWRRDECCGITLQRLANMMMPAQGGVPGR